MRTRRFPISLQLLRIDPKWWTNNVSPFCGRTGFCKILAVGHFRYLCANLSQFRLSARFPFEICASRNAVIPRKSEDRTAKISVLRRVLQKVLRRVLAPFVPFSLVPFKGALVFVLRFVFLRVTLRRELGRGSEKTKFQVPGRGKAP